MTSLLENNCDVDNITIYLAGIDLSPENVLKFQQLVDQYGRKLVMLDTDEAKVKIEAYHCGEWNGSTATWVRFFVLDQIPHSVDLLLWIDSDTIIVDNLTELFSIDLLGYPIAAVCDCLSYYERFRLGAQYSEPNYNAGVLLFNLVYWRSKSMLPKLMNHLKSNVHRYKINDQDLLNDYFRGRVYKLPIKYNVQGFLMVCPSREYFSIYRWRKEAFYPPEEIQTAVANPAIVHFIRFLGDYPWHQGQNFHPDRILYETWKQKSLWKDHQGSEARTDLVFRIEKALYCFLPRPMFLRLFSWLINLKLPKRPARLKETIKR